MKTDVQARGFTLTEALRNAVHRETARLVQGIGRPVLSISVRLFDVNGRRHGGPDKGCLVQVQLADGLSVVGSDVGSDLYQSVTSVFDKVLRSARARVSRRRRVRAMAMRGGLVPA
jgi:ribosome-associated translation inhibitor RaiA